MLGSCRLLPAEPRDEVPAAQRAEAVRSTWSFKRTFMPWPHWQEFRQQTRDTSDFWGRYLRIGRFMILWNAPDYGTPNSVAHIGDPAPTELRISKEKP